MVFANMILYSVITFNGKFSERSCEEGRWFVCYINKLSFLYGAFTRMITFTQMYEWLSMRAIIIWQSSKDLTQALYSLNDENNLISFQKIENKIEKVWLLCCVITFVICLTG